jgi:uncharacterized protein YabE (DUF348 family)
MKKVFALVAVGTVLTATACGLGANVALASDVTVTIDGQTTQARVVHSSVAEVLSDYDVQLTTHDVVSPALSSIADENTPIVVEYGRLINLDLDGTKSELWTTRRSVADLLTDLNVTDPAVKLFEGDSRIEPDTEIGRDGMSLTIDTGKDITVTVDGQTLSVHTHGTVATGMEKLGLTWDDDDIVTPELTTAVEDGLHVTVVRVVVETYTKEVKIPYETETEEDESLATGETKTETEGEDGITTETYTKVTHDGVVVQDEKTDEKVTKEPVTEVILKGPTYGAGDVEYPDDVWERLAQCESSGNPRAVNPNGHYGLYQFSLATWRSVGGTGNPIDASPEEQTMRAQMLQQKAGWGQWSCAYTIGLI